MNTIKKVLALLLIFMMIMPISLPVISKAIDLGIISRANATIDVELKRDEENPNIVHITATDSEYNITQLKYTHQYIDTDNIDYFEQENEDIYTFDITPAQTIQETFELDGYGSYTVYAKNSRGDRFLSRLTVNDPNDMPQITLTKEEENPLVLNIQVTSKQNTITKLKIAKKENINDTIDFSTQGTDIDFIQNKEVSVRYTGITEEGLYVVYAEDSEGNKATRQIYVAKQNTPITVEITEGNNPREVNLNITDAICDIVSVKVAKSSEISDINDFEKIEGLEITKGKNVQLTYTAPEDNTYAFCIEDEAGYKLMTQKRITADEEGTMHVTIEQDENSPGNLTITATNDICDIVQMKVAIGNDIDMDYFENNGEEISIEPGREVVGNYTVNENCTIHVYVKDEEGYSYMYTRTLIGIDEPEPEPNKPPVITLTQNEQNPKQIDVNVRDEDSSIDQVKWAKGNQNVAYFATNGTQIGQGIIGNVVRTEFTIDAIGTYTVYAKDEEGNETVQTIDVANIEEPPVEEDTTPPQISDIQNNGIYNHSVKPTVVDEHLAEVNLTKDGVDVEDYNNGDMIEDEGEYVLNAVDETGNESVVKFTIDKTAPEITIDQKNVDNQNVEVSILLSDKLTKVHTVKAAKGEQTIEYFENNGQELTIEKEGNTANAAIKIMENGTYTIYVKDEAGNGRIQTFEVTTIVEEPEIDDTTPPTIETTNEIINENESVKVTINVKDTESQIAKIKFASGTQDIAYFENNGTTLQMITDDKSAEAAVMIEKNGNYTIYVEDEQANAAIRVITITEIETPDPEPEPEPDDDITPPTITGVKDDVTYGTEVTPRIEDEHLASVTLTKNGNAVEGYKNGDTISENGTYVLTAIDEAGNQTVVKFIIDIEEEDNNNTNNTNSTNSTNSTNNTINDTNTENSTNNTNTNNNTGIDNTTDNSNTNDTDADTDTNNNNVSGNNQSVDNTYSSKLPYAGLGNILVIGIVIASVVAIFTYIKYKKYE